MEQRHSLYGLARDRKRLAMVVLACFFGTVLGLTFMSAGLKDTSAGIACTLNSTSPLWMLPLAHVMLNEKVGWATLACTVAAVGGVFLVMVPV